MFEPKTLGGEKLLENFIKLQREVYKGSAIMKRMQGKPVNWVWFVNFLMNRFTRKLTPEIYL